jgi:hypothetical protein
MSISTFQTASPGTSISHEQKNISVSTFQTASSGTPLPQASPSLSAGPEVQALICGQSMCFSLKYKFVDESLDDLGQTSKWPWKSVVTRPLFELLWVRCGVA